MDHTVEHPATWPRRMLALVIDWIACSLVALVILGADRFSSPGMPISQDASFITLGVYWLEASVGTALAGASFGQLATKVRVLQLDGSVVPLIPAVVRTFLICLVIPPLIFRQDGRGLHDVAVGSATYDLTAMRKA